jgi:hypothetical protein
MPPPSNQHDDSINKRTFRVQMDSDPSAQNRCQRILYCAVVRFVVFRSFITLPKQYLLVINL